MLQSCGTDRGRHAPSLKAVACAPLASPLKKRQSASKLVLTRPSASAEIENPASSSAEETRRTTGREGVRGLNMEVRCFAVGSSIDIPAESVNGLDNLIIFMSGGEPVGNQAFHR